jgi:hypothetical protein
LLGVLSDEQTARQLNRTVGAVEVRRVSFGIPPFASKWRKWTPEEDKLFSTLSNVEIARRLNRHPGVVSVHRHQLGLVSERYWTPAEDRLLGTVADGDVARRLKRPINGVKHRRCRLKIPAWRPKRTWMAAGHHGAVWSQCMSRFAQAT